jgi:hypothetical protein
MKPLFAILSMTLLLNACALSAPDGEKQLEKIIEADKRQDGVDRDAFAGRPRFLKVRSYKQIYNGDIHSEHWIFVQVGRENLSIEDLVE